MKITELKEKQIQRILLLVLSVICLVSFSLQVWKGYPDIPDHNRFITRWLSGDAQVKLYSLYYLVILTVSFFQNHAGLINVVSIVILTLSVCMKFMLSNYIFKQEFSDTKTDIGQKFQFWRFHFDLNGITLSLVFLIGLTENLIYKPSATMALGYLPVNTWHNSTTIFLMPFAIWLFYKSYLFIKNHHEQENNFSSLLTLLLLTIFSVFIKPSYFFVFAIAFPLYYLLRFGINKNLFYSGLVSLFSAAALLLVYRYVYVGSDSSITIHPFHVWSYWSTNIPMGLVSSILFPLLFLIFYFRQTLKDHLLSYAWVQMAVAILIYILLSETGGREMHGNFGWQTIICNYLLFFCTWILYLRILLTKIKFEMKDRIIIGSFLLHVSTGLLFLLKIPFYGAR